MANKKEHEALITNEDTLVRRAWIESAIEGVRARIEGPLPPAEYGNLAAGDPGSAYMDDAEGPQLYVVWDADQRRSGT